MLTPQRTARLARQYALQYGAQPDAAMLQELVDGDVHDEILFREVLELGLDKDDEIVRRRIIQKMQFLLEDLRAPPDRTTPGCRPITARISTGTACRPEPLSATSTFPILPNARQASCSICPGHPGARPDRGIRSRTYMTSPTTAASRSSACLVMASSPQPFSHTARPLVGAIPLDLWLAPALRAIQAARRGAALRACSRRGACGLSPADTTSGQRPCVRQLGRKFTIVELPH